MSNKVSDNLHRLIKSLTTAEKRYFKLYSSRHTLGEQNVYVKLFDAIDKQKDYNEAEILEQFHGLPMVNSFSIAKMRLYDAVLRALDAFHANSSVDAQLKRDLHCAEILYKKTLYAQCARILQSAKKVAQKYEKHAALSEIFLWEKRLIETENYSGKSEEDILKILKDDELAAEKIKNFNEYWSIKSRLFMLLNTKGRVRTQQELASFKEIIDNTLLKGESKALTVETKYLFNHIYSAYHFGIGDYAKCREDLKKNVELIEGHTHIFEEEPNIYFSVLTNIIYVCSQLKKYDETFFYLKKLRTVPEVFDISRNADLEMRLFASSYSVELTLYNSIGEFEKSIELVPRIEEGLEKYEGSLNKLREAYFYFNISGAYFGAGKYSQALRWLHRLMNDKGIDENQDIRCIAQIFNLIIEIELKKDDLLPYTYKTTQRYLTSRKRVYKFETLFLNFVEKLMKTKSSTEHTEFYKSLLAGLEELEKDKFEKTVFGYFDFISWAESKIRNVPFRLVVEEKMQVKS